MLSINMSDVMNVITSIKSYLIAIGIIVAVAIVIMIAVMKLKKSTKKFVRGTALVAMLTGIVICVNMICTGPMSTMLDLVSGSGTISKETSDEATELAQQIAEEGIVLIENDGNTLPLASGTKLNVFGWASTNPILGGAGSGSLNESYDTISILQSLADAGIETNSELSQFYTDYKSDRPTVGMWDQDWTLPEPNVSLYTDELIANAKAFSDTAMIVISRSGGEGADLPDDMPAVVDGTFVDENGIEYENGAQIEIKFDSSERSYQLYWIVLPDKANNKAVRFLSNKENEALVNEDGRVTFIVKTDVTITIQSVDVPAIKASITLCVKIDSGGGGQL